MLLYLKLSIWPWPLIIHRETTLLWTFSDALLWLLPVALAAGGVLFLLSRRNAVGYLGAWFFAILLPTVVMPMPSEAVAERRMYLPLAAVVVLVIIGGYALIRWRTRTESAIEPADFHRSLPLRAMTAGTIGLVLVLAFVTSRRLQAYSDVITIWRDAVAYQPENVRATLNLGCALQDAGRDGEAIEQFERDLDRSEAARRGTGAPEPRFDLGSARPAGQGHPPFAARHATASRRRQRPRRTGFVVARRASVPGSGATARAGRPPATR